MPGTGKIATVLVVVRELKWRVENHVSNSLSVLQRIRYGGGLLTGIKSIHLCRDRRVEDLGASRSIQPALGGGTVTRQSVEKKHSILIIVQRWCFCWTWRSCLVGRIFLHLQDALLAETGSYSVVLMDELHQLLTAKQDVLYTLFNRLSFTNPRLTLLAVECDGSSRVSFDAESPESFRFVFPPYQPFPCSNGSETSFIDSADSPATHSLCLSSKKSCWYDLAGPGMDFSLVLWKSRWGMP